LDVTGVADLNEVGSSVVATMAPWALARDRTIAFKGFRDPVLVKGNRHAIGDAIRNLVENAVLHSPAWSEVLVRTSPDGRVSVADRGPGITPADQERIFDRFWRGKGVQFEGAGLGLAIVKEIMNAHGGTVSIENRSPDGAVFALHFTMVDREDEKSTGSRHKSASEKTVPP